jgi:hypothetical protein
MLTTGEVPAVTEMGKAPVMAVTGGVPLTALVRRPWESTTMVGLEYVPAVTVVFARAIVPEVTIGPPVSPVPVTMQEIPAALHLTPVAQVESTVRTCPFAPMGSDAGVLRAVPTIIAPLPLMQAVGMYAGVTQQSPVPDREQAVRMVPSAPGGCRVGTVGTDVVMIPPFVVRQAHGMAAVGVDQQRPVGLAVEAVRTCPVDPTGSAWATPAAVAPMRSPLAVRQE